MPPPRATGASRNVCSRSSEAVGPTPWPSISRRQSHNAPPLVRAAAGQAIGAAEHACARLLAAEFAAIGAEAGGEGAAELDAPLADVFALVADALSIDAFLECRQQGGFETRSRGIPRHGPPGGASAPRHATPSPTPRPPRHHP